MKRQKTGWAQPSNSRKNHYFMEDRRSLCGRWAFFGELTKDVPEDDSSNDCAACLRKLKKIRLSTPTKVKTDG